MPSIYSTTAPSVTPEPLDRDALANIGRLIRSCAEIEDIVTLFIYVMADTSEQKGVLLVGRSGIRSRMTLAGQLAKLHSADASKTFVESFPPDFWEVFDCRNAVAHGTLLGKTQEGAWMFLTASTVVKEGEALSQTVMGFTAESLMLYADAAESFVPQLEERLRVKPLRDARGTEPLAVHPKAQSQQKAR